MKESVPTRYARWKLEDLLQAYDGLRLIPGTGGTLKIGGTIAFTVRPHALELITDEYEIEMAVAPSFPSQVPEVRETGGRIPLTHHKLDDGSLCLGSPTRLLLITCGSPTLKGFIDRCVIPYLYGYSYFERHGTMPFHELSHGEAGIREDFALLYGVSDRRLVEEFIRLTGMRKRVANKLPCPCGSTRRLGRCHHRRVNAFRDRLGRSWFREWYAVLSGPRESFGTDPRPPRPGSHERPSLPVGEKVAWIPRDVRSRRTG